MGREVKRVALDFSWPINRTWYGYVKPDDLYPTNCDTCDGTGMTDDYRQISESWYTHLCPPGEEGWSDKITQDEVDALVENRRLMDFTHEWITSETVIKISTKDEVIIRLGLEPMEDDDEDVDYVQNWIENGSIELSDTGEYTITSGWVRREDRYVPTAAEVNEWSKSGMGHDSCNRWICAETRAKRLGKYGHCTVCDGDGSIFKDADHEAAYDAWMEQDPRAGEGWQLWENVSEGSPQSPVFATKEELSTWMQNNGDGNSGGYSKESADAFINQGWAPSMMIINGTMMTGVDSAAALQKDTV